MCMCIYIHIYICIFIHPVIVAHSYYETRAQRVCSPNLDKEQNTLVCILADFVIPGVSTEAAFVLLEIFCYSWALVCTAHVMQATTENTQWH